MRGTRRPTSAGLAAAVAALAATTAGLAGEAKQAKLGDPAPDFTLTDTEGKQRSLADYEGRIVVLEWINQDCPYVEECYKSKAMQEAREKVKELAPDAAWMAINTTHYTTTAQNAAWIKQFKLDYPILLDTEGEVGRAYDAKKTPHMFVIDAKGVLRYHGAFDDRPLHHDQEANNYVVNAVRQIVEGETVAPDNVRPWGCSVKYKKK